MATPELIKPLLIPINTRAAVVGGDGGTPTSLTVTPFCLNVRTAAPYGRGPVSDTIIAYPATGVAPEPGVEVLRAVNGSTDKLTV
jgi:hypothetical protein